MRQYCNFYANLRYTYVRRALRTYVDYVDVCARTQTLPTSFLFQLKGVGSVVKARLPGVDDIDTDGDAFQ